MDETLSHSTKIVTGRGTMCMSKLDKTFQRLESIAILVGSSLPVLPFEDDEACVGLVPPAAVRGTSSVLSACCAWNQALF